VGYQHEGSKAGLGRRLVECVVDPNYSIQAHYRSGEEKCAGASILVPLFPVT
jgi:hypothetical protein